ncbi:MAG TPA: PIG-L deacetylase family protein [Bryobacteraceae bacterium]|nr:PIG-L deacetylase family protein [Bryobacteraceae bacterium]
MPLDLEDLRTRRTLVVAAHPDDETVGPGAVLAELRDVTIVHVTGGSPANPSDARAAGFQTEADYARARREEVVAALRLAGIGLERTREIGLRDQGAAAEMAVLARRLSALLEELRPDVLLTHPYEGGHPDHDATAFGVHASCAMMHAPPQIVEFACYHGLHGWMETGGFLPGGPDAVQLILNDEAQSRKQAMLACFVSQRETLRAFSMKVERYRPAPRYRFTERPHAGVLNYERYDWGMTGPRFRALAREALAELELEDWL